jgi:hypothetical protein
MNLGSPQTTTNAIVSKQVYAGMPTALPEQTTISVVTEQIVIDIRQKTDNLRGKK